MNNETLQVDFIGGGGTGQTAIGYLNAVEAGSVPGVQSAQVVAHVGTGDDGGKTGYARKITGTAAVGDINRSIADMSADQQSAFDLRTRFDDKTTIEAVTKLGYQMAATLSYHDSYQSRTSDGTNVSTERSRQIIDNAVALGREWISDDEQALIGLTLGHLILTSLTLESNIEQAAEETGRLMLARGRVIPTVVQPNFVKLRDGDEVTVGEHKLDEGYVLKNPDDFEISLVHDQAGTQAGVTANPVSIENLQRADQIVIGPGSMLGSTLQALAAVGVHEVVREAIADPSREVFLLGNIEHATETNGWTVHRFADAHSKAIGKAINTVIGNTDTDGVENPVVFDEDRLAAEGDDYAVVQRPIRSRRQVIYQPGDAVAAAGLRSGVAHDMDQVAIAMGETRLAKIVHEPTELAA